MSVKYIPVQWNANKWFYDAAVLLAVMAYLYVFVNWTPAATGHERNVSGAIHNARAFGSCAFLMLTVILCIGPLARLDSRFLPLLYNRRHFGVLTLFVALAHAGFVLDWYFAFSPTPALEGLLSSNTSFNRLLGFPFELLGVFALVVLMVLAFTSHDFWLKFLGAQLWKRLHMLLYPAYAVATGHVSLGALQDQTHPALAIGTLGAATLVGGLHTAAWWHERRSGATSDAEWVDVASPADFREGFARIVSLSPSERVAVFRHGDLVSAISNACAHQNGPLGEGRILDGCVTCPWHGFQYRVTDGCSPAPFTEKVPTYRLRLHEGAVQVDRNANPPGTPVEPLRIAEVAP